VTPRIQQAWNDYLQAVIPAGAPAVQITESKRAFFAGALAAFTVYHEIAEPEVSEDEGVERLTSLYQELMAFTDAVGTEREIEIRVGRGESKT